MSGPLDVKCTACKSAFSLQWRIRKISENEIAKLSKGRIANNYLPIQLD